MNIWTWFNISNFQRSLLFKYVTFKRPFHSSVDVSPTRSLAFSPPPAFLNELARPPRARPTPPTWRAALLIERLDSHSLKQLARLSDSRRNRLHLCAFLPACARNSRTPPSTITREPFAVVAAAKRHAGVSRPPRVRRGAAAAAGMLHRRQGMEGDEERRHGAAAAAPGGLSEPAAATGRGDAGAQRQQCG